MKGLVIGNSQVAALRMADDRFGGGISTHYFSQPGGNGPRLRFYGGRIYPVTSGDRVIVAEPQSLAGGAVLAHYDFLVFSALGLAAPRISNTRHLLNNYVVASFAPAPQGMAPASRAFMTEALAGVLRRTVGTQALLGLAQSFTGPIVVQPFPIPNELLSERDDSTTRLPGLYGEALWRLQSWYHQTQFAVMKALVAECGAHVKLLDYPDPGWLEAGFTPRRYAQGRDCWHMNEDYGALVIGQVCEALEMAAY